MLNFVNLGSTFMWSSCVLWFELWGVANREKHRAFIVMFLMKDYQFDQKHTCRNLQRDDHKLNSLCSAEKHAHHFHSSVCVSIWCNESKCIDLGDAIKQFSSFSLLSVIRPFTHMSHLVTQWGLRLNPWLFKISNCICTIVKKKKKKLIKKIYINT